jgi:hypothetical protein
MINMAALGTQMAGLNGQRSLLQKTEKQGELHQYTGSVLTLKLASQVWLEQYELEQKVKCYMS